MIKNTLTALGFVLMMITASPSLGAQTPLKTADLDTKQKAIFDTLAGQVYCYFGCEETLAECLNAKPVHPSTIRLANLLVRQIQKGKDEATIKKAVEKRGLSIFNPKTYKIGLEGLKPYGATDLKPLITIIEYGDFQCPFCAAIAPKLHKVIDQHKGEIVLYFKHFPVKSHKKAIHASRAAIAVEQQGKFWEYYFMLYKNRENIDPADLRSYAASLGLDMAAFDKAYKDKTGISKIKKEKLEGLKMGISATPTFFINGRKYQGLKSDDEFADFLEELLEIVKAGGAG